MPQQTIYALIPFQAVTQKLVNILMQMVPFRVGNLKPVFAGENVYVHRYNLLKGAYLKPERYQIDCKQCYKAIDFGLARYEPLVSSGKPFSMAYTIGYNYYLGRQ